MPALNLPEGFAQPIHSDLFGGNFLADRYDLDPDGDVAGLIDDLGVTALRYPGGSLTERLFDIGNPDAPRVWDGDGGLRDFVPLSDFLAFAAEGGHPVTIVLPTVDNLSRNGDGNGDRWPSFDEEELRGFVSDVLSGVYGDAEIAAFEIGNEYWGSGEMSAVEYGRLSSRMADIIDDEIARVEAATGADVDTEILVQAGTNNGFSNLADDFEGLSDARTVAALNDRYAVKFDEDVIFPGEGGINWRAVNDRMVTHEFSDDEGEAVGGIVTHLYSKDPITPGSRDFALDQVEENWAHFPDADSHVTEWNLSASDPRLLDDEHFGLRQAHEMLNIFEDMVEADVAQAHVWPLLQNSRNALSTDADEGGLTVPGQMFAMMRDSLDGKSMLDFTPGDGREDEDTTERSYTHADVHGFYGEGELVLYIASTSETTQTLGFDLSVMVDRGGVAEGTLLGVRPGEAPGALSSRPVVEDLAEEEFYDDGEVMVTLDPGEILEVRLTDFRPTPEFADIMRGIDDDIVDGDEIVVIDEGTGLPAIDIPTDDDVQDDRDDDDGSDGGGGIGELLIGLLPLLLLGGLMG